MSQEKGERYFELFKTWESTMSDGDFADIVYPSTGKLNRGQVKKLSGVSGEAIKNNSKVKKALDELENRLRKKGVLPPLTELGKQVDSSPKKYDNTANRNLLDSKRVTVLEAENIELKAKVKELDAKRMAVLEAENIELKAKVKKLEIKLERFGELSETVSEMGFMPR
jgi:hypothetical protein